jgi:hypothetical protein
VETKGETQVQFSLKIRRIPTFYLINVVGPVILLAILNEKLEGILLIFSEN